MSLLRDLWQAQAEENDGGADESITRLEERGGLLAIMWKLGLLKEGVRRQRPRMLRW